jgi:hypothetical protein
MKRYFLFVILFLYSFFIIAQQKQKQILWFNNKLIHTSTIEVEDSSIVGTIWETDTVQFIIPHALVQIVRDTVVIHDTLVQVVHDTINHYYTNWVRDTLVVNNYVEIDPVISKKYQGIHYFSVGDKKRVLFSPGNLQYNAKSRQWRFAKKQYEIVGEKNVNIGNEYSGWIDLFGWGTSFPTNSSTMKASYSNKFIDWGIYQIGSDKPKSWRTLTQEEWVYLIEERPNARALCGMAQVDGVNGLIILPDIWVTPPTVIFKKGVCAEPGKDSYAKHQSLTAEQWVLMEKAGAIFLPAAGYRYGREVFFVGMIGRYWSSSVGEDVNASTLFFYDIELSPRNFDNCCRGLSVRLVKDI